MNPLSQSYFAYRDFSLKRLCVYSLQPASSREEYFQWRQYYSLHISAKLSIVAGFLGSHRTSRKFAYFFELSKDFHLYTYFAKILTSYISTYNSLMLNPRLFSSFRSQLYNLLMVVDLTQSVSKGWQGSPAKSQRTQLAMVIPRIAGIVPKTGTILILQLSKTLKLSGSFSCTSFKGNSSFQACWQENATFTPPFMFFLFNSLFNRVMRLSYLQSAISRICSLVGSHFMPAPPEQISLMLRSLQMLTISAFASRLSIQSITQSKSGVISSAAFFTVTQVSTVSTTI